MELMEEEYKTDRKYVFFDSKPDGGVLFAQLTYSADENFFCFNYSAVFDVCFRNNAYALVHSSNCRVYDIAHSKEEVNFFVRKEENLNESTLVYYTEHHEETVEDVLNTNVVEKMSVKEICDIFKKHNDPLSYFLDLVNNFI